VDATRAYSTFVRAFEAGSFSAVARESGMTQSAVSKIIAGLEASLGVQLFTRTTRKLHPTSEAEQLYEAARQMLDTLEGLGAASRKSQAPDPSGLLRITIPGSFGRRRVLPVLARYSERHPKVRLDVLMTDEVLDLVADGLELAIRIGTLPSNTLIARSLGIVEHTLLASPDYLARRGRPDSPAELADHACIVYDNQTRWNFESEHGRQSVEVGRGLHINDADSIVELARAGLGIAQVPDWIITGDFAAQGLVPLLPDYYPIPKPISIVYPQTRFLSSRARSFIDLVVSELRRL
jgi:DNA-binding transcriptional LysR family regulator